MPPILTQERFPRLWFLFHAIFGATREKQRLALKHLGDRRRVVEIGCSLGVVSEAFGQLPELSYLGIDIDTGAVDHARRRLSGYSNLSFSTKTMGELADQGFEFDYVLFANILHHVDDATAVTLISDAMRLVAPGGRMVLIEPDILRKSDNMYIRFLHRLERGEYRRPPAELDHLLAAAGAVPTNFYSEDVSIDSIPWFTAGHLLIYTIDMPKDGR